MTTIPVATRPLLLTDVTVVEFGRFVTAPYAARLLGDLGAEVIKVETGGGDPFRGFGSHPEFSTQFTALNRNKQSIVLDPRDDADYRALRDIIAGADVFIENSRPGSMERLGLDYVTLVADNERLVYCSINGAGREGPLAQRPAYDHVGQALSGMASQYVDPDVPRVVGPNLSDSLSGLTAAYMILGALHARDRDGRGQWIEVDMVRSTLALLGHEAQAYFDSGEVSRPDSRPSNSSSFVVRSADGKLLAIHVSSLEKFWQSLTAALDAPQLAADPRFTTRSGRAEHYEQLRVELQRLADQRQRSDMLVSLREHDVPAAPVHNLDDVFEDPELAPLRLRQTIPGPGHSHDTLAVPAQFNGADVGIMTAAPGLGQHTDAVVSRTRTGQDARTVNGPIGPVPPR